MLGRQLFPQLYNRIEVILLKGVRRIYTNAVQKIKSGVAYATRDFRGQIPKY